jgi:hypothetical protein
MYDTQDYITLLIMSKSNILGIFCSVLLAAQALLIHISHAEVEGKYTSWIKNLLEQKNYVKLSKNANLASNPVQLTCLETAGSPFYIGIVQEMTVQAPLAEVSKVVEGIDQLVDLFPGYASIKLLSRDDSQPIGRWVTAWEQRIPLFFIPNVKYQMIYFIHPATSMGKTYRYQLNSAGTIQESDGMIVLEKKSETETHYIEVDFFKADWGVVETLAPGRIWKDSADGLYLSDLAIKLKAELPELSEKRARENAENFLANFEKTTKKSVGEICSEQKTLHWSEKFPGLALPQ